MTNLEHALEVVEQHSDPNADMTLPLKVVVVLAAAGKAVACESCGGTIGYFDDPPCHMCFEFRKLCNQEFKP